MTKQALQEELKSKVKPGIKPSQLKRSRSAGDIPKAPPLPSSDLTRSKSQEFLNDPKYPFTSLISQQEKIVELTKESQAKSETIKLLRDKIEKLEKAPPSPLLADQLKEKQKEIESLREKLEEQNALIQEKTQELDNSLIARHESVKHFEKVFDKWKDTELNLLQIEDEATDDIIWQDKEISKLRKENSQLKTTNQTLQRDLNLAQRLAQLRKIPLPFHEPSENWFNPPFWWIITFSLIAWCLIKARY